METIQENQQEINTILTKKIIRDQVQDLYDIMQDVYNIADNSTMKDKYHCVKDVLYSLLQYPDQEYHIIIKKLGHKDPLYYLSINNIYNEKDINQKQAIALHDLLQGRAPDKLIRKYKPKNRKVPNKTFNL